MKFCKIIQHSACILILRSNVSAFTCLNSVSSKTQRPKRFNFTNSNDERKFCSVEKYLTKQVLLSYRDVFVHSMARYSQVAKDYQADSPPGKSLTAFKRARRFRYVTNKRRSYDSAADALFTLVISRRRLTGAMEMFTIRARLLNS